jgi:hypothetical protein
VNNSAAGKVALAILSKQNHVSKGPLYLFPANIVEWNAQADVAVAGILGNNNSWLASDMYKLDDIKSRGTALRAIEYIREDAERPVEKAIAGYIPGRN